MLCLSLDSHPHPDTVASYSATLKQAEALIAKLKVKRFGEGATVEDKLHVWRNRLKRVTEGNGLPQYSKNSVTLKEPYCPVAKYLPDPDAALAHATRQAGGNVEWGVQWPYGDFFDLLKPGKTYVVRMRIKPEFKATPQKPGTLFKFSSYTVGGTGTGSVFTGNFSANDNGQYRWLELGKLQIVTPNAVGYLFCTSGNLTSDEAVWYDYLEFVPEDEFKDAELAAKLAIIKI